MEKTNAKVTKAMVLAAIVEEFAGQDEATVLATVNDVDVTVADVIAYAEKTQEQLANRNAKAKEKAAEKRAQGDELREKVLAVITDEPQTRADIAAQVEGEDITVNKVGARITQLVEAGLVVKEQATIDKRRVMTYKLA